MNNLELLNKEDIDKIKIRNSCYSIINEKVEKYTDEVMEETFAVLYKYNTTIKEIDDSQFKFDKLKHQYWRTSEWCMSFFMGLILIIFFLMTCNAPNKEYELVRWLLGIGGCIAFYSGVKQFIIRNKIKDNFKELGVK